jgi:hypothetical protein
MSYSWISRRHFLNCSSFLCDNYSFVKLTQNQPVQKLTIPSNTSTLREIRGTRGRTINTFSTWLTQPTFLYIPRPPAHSDSTHIGLDPLTSVIRQENVPRDLPTVQLDRGIFSIDIFSCPMTLAVSSWQTLTSTESTVHSQRVGIWSLENLILNHICIINHRLG